MNRYFHKDIIKSNNYQSLDYLEKKTIEKSKKTEDWKFQINQNSNSRSKDIYISDPPDAIDH